MASDRITLWVNSPAQPLSGTAAADVLRGGLGVRNMLLGLDGADSLNSASGADVLVGGRGDDVYYVKGASDLVVELAGDGHDTVATSVSYALPANVEDLSLLETAELDGIGNRLANTINGNAGANVLLGLSGADQLRGNEGGDVLDGGAGDDYLSGGEGADILVGGQGVDDLYGGAGADIFVFDHSDLRRSGGLDRIGDFNGVEGDRIDLTPLTSPGQPSLIWLGTSAFSGRAGELNYAQAEPGILTVSADFDGDGAADIRITVAAERLVSSDFLLTSSPVGALRASHTLPVVADEPGPGELALVRLSVASQEIAGSALAQATISFLEPQRGLSLSDFAATHGRLSRLEQLTPQTYRVVFTPDADYTGAATISLAPGAYARVADATVALAETAYQFFTGRTPTEAGLAYLVSSPANPADLTDAYYAQFNLENRYINFAVNLGKYGEGAGAFAARYGAMTLAETMRDAYGVIFGSVPSAEKAAALAEPRAAYFAAYGQDGPAGLGTKAAAVGWLLAEAVKADVGVYATAVNAFLAHLDEGAAQHNVDLVGVYAPGGLGAFAG